MRATMMSAAGDVRVIEPGRVLDRRTGIDGVADGYRAMADRESIKVLVKS